MSAERVIVFMAKADRQVKGHVRAGKFVNSYKQKYKLGTQHEVHVSDDVFEMLGIPKRPVFADWARMFDKHMEQFKSVEQLARAAQWVLRRPDYKFKKAENPLLMNFIRQNYKHPFEHPIVAVSFMYKHGSRGYLIRSVHLISTDQVSGKIADAVHRQLGDHSVMTFEFGKAMSEPVPNADEFVFIRQMVPEAA